ncbi:MAG: M28 family peptidase [Planctomycetia bacterium]|jgi:hypothetical protein
MKKVERKYGCRPRTFVLRFLFLGMIAFGGVASLYAGEQGTAVASQAVQETKVASDVVPEHDISESELHRHIATLASDEFKGRDPANEGGPMAAKYLTREFEKLGLKPKGNKGLYAQKFIGSRSQSMFWTKGRKAFPKDGKVAQKTGQKGIGFREEDGKEGDSKEDDPDAEDEDGKNAKSPMSDKEMDEAAQRLSNWLNRQFQKRKRNEPNWSCRNVLGLLPGSDPKLKDEIIIVSAHFDHLGVRNGKVYNGADDNASGTASVLELARVLSHRKEPLRRSVLFAAWDGEEKGLLGSSHWAQSSTIPMDRVVAVINLDMIGRLRNDKLLVLGGGSSKQLSEMINTHAEKAKFKILDWKMGGNSDHWPFCVSGIPSVTFCTGIHKDYHAPTDDIELVHFDGLRRIDQMVLELVTELANRDARVEFTNDP